MSFHDTCLRAFVVVLALATSSFAGDAETFNIAREAHTTANFDDAMKLYQRITEGPFAEAARCYEGDCLARLGKFDDATAVYQNAVNATEFKTYRGEMLLELARIHCLRATTPDVLDKAKTCLRDALVWHEITASDKKSVAAEKLTPASVPGMITAQTPLNPQSAAWYMPALKAETLRLLIYLHVCLGESEAAGKALDQLAETEASLPVMLRLPHAGLKRDITRGSFLVPLSVWRAWTPAHQPRTRFAFFYLATASHLFAEPLLRELHAQTAEGAGNAEDWAAAEIGLALCEWEKDDRGSAIKRLSLFENILRGTTASRFGRLLLANHLAGDPKTYNKSIRLYGDLVTEPGSDPAASQALLAMVVASANQADAQTCYRAADQLRSKHADSAENRLAQAVLDLMAPSSAPSQTAPNTRLRGGASNVDSSVTRVLTTRFVLPTDGTVAEKQLTPVIRCELSAESLANDIGIALLGLATDPGGLASSDVTDRKTFVVQGTD